jgi:4-amino-4-deoxy-L-arabinose transferase-like glycosyltransferase
LFLAGSLALAGAARLAWRERREPAIRFLLAWIVPFWVLLELVPTKLPHYALPAYPALALLAGQALASGIRRHWSDLVAWSVWGLGALGLGVAMVTVPIHFGGGSTPLAVVMIAVAMGFAGWQVRSLWLGQARVWMGVGAALMLWATAFGLVAPGIDALWLSRSAAELVNAQDRVGRPVVVAGYAEPSLVFLLGTATKLTSAAAAAAIVARLPDTLVLVSDREAAAFRSAVEKNGVSVDSLGNASGLNYSNGRAVTLTLYETAR